MNTLKNTLFLAVSALALLSSTARAEYGYGVYPYGGYRGGYGMGERPFPRMPWEWLR